MINGINNVIVRPDLIDRSLNIKLKTIESKNRLREKELIDAFNNDYPVIFTALLLLFRETLRQLPNIHIDTPPRMIDFAYLGEAMCLALDNGVSFNELFRENRRNSLYNSIDSSPVGISIMMMLDKETQWEGTLKELKKHLTDNYFQEGKGWPKSPNELGDSLNRLEPAFRELGYHIEFYARYKNEHQIRMNNSNKEAKMNIKTKR